MNTKKILLTLILLATSALAFAQTPATTKHIGYQALLRQADGNPIASENVTVKITINQGSATGAELYSESHDGVKTSSSGLLSLEIGGKDEAAFSAIDWAAADAWLNVEVTTRGATQQTIRLAQRLQAVPYAYYAEKVAGLEALKTAMEEKAGKAELDLKADKADLDLKADKADLDLKADKADLDLKADKADLDLMAAKADLDALASNLEELKSKMNAQDVEALQERVNALEKWIENLEKSEPYIQAMVDPRVAELDNIENHLIQSTIGKGNDLSWLNGELNVTANVSLNESLDPDYVANIKTVLPSPFNQENKATFEGKISLSVHMEAGKLRLDMTRNAMGLNEFFRYFVIYGIFGAYGDDFYANPLGFAGTYTNQDMCNIIGWDHKDAAHLGELNATLNNILILAQQNGISQLKFVGSYVDGYGDIKEPGVPFKFEYSPLTKLKSILNTPSDPNYPIAKDCMVLNQDEEGNWSSMWFYGAPDPYQHVADCDLSLLDDLRHPDVPAEQKLDDISKLKGEINWADKKITFRFPTCTSTSGTYIYVDVTITPAP